MSAGGAGDKAAEKKVGVFRWRGLLAASKKSLRAAVLTLLALSCVALTFAQLGFVGIGTSGEYSAYAVLLLQPVALGALLLGTLQGLMMGLFAGVVLQIHATIMPLNYYELAFVTPMTSLAMLTIAGFLLGVLFALALRKNPMGWRRYVPIVIICSLVSWLYSLGFVVNVFVSMLTYAVENYEMSDSLMADQSFRTYLYMMALRLGDVGLQAWFDALCMIVVCLVGDYAARKAIELQSRRTLRSVFNGWLAAVVTAAFLVSATVSFCLVSQDEWSEAKELAETEVQYLCNQLAVYDERAVALDDALSSASRYAGSQTIAGVPEIDRLSNSLGFESLLEGYTEEVDGTVLVIDRETGVIRLSDDPHFVPGEDLADHVNRETLLAIDRSASTGSFERIVFDNPGPSVGFGDEDAAARYREEGGEVIQADLGYLEAQVEGDHTVVMVLTADKVFSERPREMGRTSALVVVLLIGVFAMTSNLLKRLVLTHIDETNDVLAAIAQGDLDARVAAYDTAELASLGEGINNTVSALNGWIAEAEARMDAELETAGAIQESSLPRIFPPYPDVLRFDIYASMSPAKEVGGDFYDFFLIGEGCGADAGKLGFVIADVSGKSVPAALFMMNAKALVRGYMESGVELGEAMENANRKLCEGNDSGMFVTLFAGILDYASFHVDFVNAGHNPPLLWQEGGWRWLRQRSGLPLGLFEGIEYKAHSLDCAIGDQFLLYTDGVTEAMNENGELYGEKRLEDIATESYPMHPRELIESVRHDVARYVGDAEQSDDLTLLALEVGVPPEITATLIVDADVNELPRVNEFIHNELDRRMCPQRTQGLIDIAVEELFVNVAHYAYPNATADDPGVARVSYTYSADPPSITIDLSDDGIPYNPLDKPDAVTPENIEDVPIGGLGILMAKRSVDEMRYERVDGSNIVTIVKRW